MDNSVQSEDDHWCFRQYIWHNDLDKRKLPDGKVIDIDLWCKIKQKSVRERGLDKTAKISAYKYPKVNDIV